MGVKPEQHFRLHDGKKIKNLYELSKALSNMQKKIFSHHVTTRKNDFANWVRKAVRDETLASKLESVKTAQTMKKYIDEKIKPVKKVRKQKTVVEDYHLRQHHKPRISTSNCPYRTFLKCGWQEMLVGIIVGLLIAMLLSLMF